MGYSTHRSRGGSLDRFTCPWLVQGARRAATLRPCSFPAPHLVGLIVQRTNLEDDAAREALAVVRDEIPSDVVV